MSYSEEPVKGYLSQVERNEFDEICDRLIEHDLIEDVGIHEGGSTYSEFKIDGKWWYISCTNSVIDEDPAIFTDYIQTADTEKLDQIFKDLGVEDKVYGPINMVWTI